ncbi:hypothetical protein C5S32_08060 [ANME-1 cluster archaeon GoMg1]|nr:hypothetical protein [ANME-1 cluster archaeon GoMg1]
MTLKFRHKRWFVFIISILLLMDLAILLNIPYIRQILGFLFLTILPGLLILQVLKLDKLKLTEKVVLSVGLSISFLLFFGLLINNLSLSLGYEAPLSTVPLLIWFNFATIALILVAYRMNTNVVFSLPNFDLSPSEKAFLIVPVMFPALSIFGMHIMNTTDNNIILMFLLFLIPVYVVFVCLFNHKFPKRLYPAVLFLIGLSLLLLMSLKSNHIIIGSDTGRELYFFRTTLSNLHWSIISHQTFDACLSISILPTIYQSILHVNEEYLFKILYSLIFSISPLAIYTLSKKYVGSLYAFLASFFFMSQGTFLRTSSMLRTNTAILFCLLAIMTLFNDNISKVNKRLLFIIFLASVTVSHYSTTYIFFFLLLLTWFGTKIISLKRKPVTASGSHTVKEGSPLLWKESTIESSIRKGITITVITLFFTIIFFWYSQLTEAAFTSGVGFIQSTFLNLNEFFLFESRSGMVPALFGKSGRGILHTVVPVKIAFYTTWMTFVLMGIGVVSMLYRYRKMLSPEGTINSKSKFLKTEFETEYIAMAIGCLALLIVMIALPFVSTGYDIQRLYLQMVIVLSPCFVLGGIILSSILQFVFTNGIRWFKDLKLYVEKRSCNGNIIRSKDTKSIKIQPFLVILIILVPYFLSTTGVSYQIFGFTTAITLNSGTNSTSIIYDQDSYGAKWLEQYRDKEEMIYTSGYGFEVLGSQGKIPPSEVNTKLVLVYEENREITGYIYLRHLQVVDGKMAIRRPRSGREVLNMTDLPDMLTMNRKNKIYNNGGSEVYR